MKVQFTVELVLFACLCLLCIICNLQDFHTLYHAQIYKRSVLALYHVLHSPVQPQDGEHDAGRYDDDDAGGGDSQILSEIFTNTIG